MQMSNKSDQSITVKCPKCAEVIELNAPQCCCGYAMSQSEKTKTISSILERINQPRRNQKAVIHRDPPELFARKRQKLQAAKKSEK
jgi:hypothetical protein